MLRKLKLAIGRHAPGFLTVAAWKVRRALAPSEAQVFEREAYAKLGEPREVLRGPFRGMKYIRMCYGGSTLTRSLGVYEQELHPWVKKIVDADPDVVVDVGTSDGYYLVGLARALPRAELAGFDAMPVCRTLTRRVARINGVARRIRVRGFCTAEQLQREIEGASRPAILCDCDTGELQVMDPGIATGLRKATILLEVHDDMQPGISAEMRRRFAETHEITEIPAQDRRHEDVPQEFGFSRSETEKILQEGRPPGNFWLFMTPRTDGATQRP